MQTKYKNKSVVKAINKFYTMLDFYHDEEYSVIKFKRFFRFFLQLEGDDRPLPSLELMSVLKDQKPTVYRLIKKDGKEEIMFGILTDSPIPLERAEERINRYLQQS